MTNVPVVTKASTYQTQLALLDVVTVNSLTPNKKYVKTVLLDVLLVDPLKFVQAVIQDINLIVTELNVKVVQITAKNAKIVYAYNVLMVGLLMKMEPVEMIAMKDSMQTHQIIFVLLVMMHVLLVTDH